MAFYEGVGCRIYYEVSGDSGPWISLINGHTRSSRDFRLMSRGLVAGGFRVLSLDNRGAGLSESEGGFTLEEMAGDWVAVWRHLGVQKSHVAGLSMGGVIAQVLAATTPEKLLSLVLISSSPGPGFMNLSKEGWSGDEGEVSERLRLYFSQQFQKKNAVLINAMARQIAKDVREHGFNEKAMEQRLAIRNFSWDVISAGGGMIPGLVVHGADDQIILPEAAAVLASKYQAELCMLPEAGHLLLGEQPKELERLLKEFWKSSAG